MNVRLLAPLLALTTAVASTPAHAQPVPAAAAEGARAQTERGLVLELHLGTYPLPIGGTNGATLSLLRGGVFGGFKLKRLIVGLGFDLLRVATAKGGSSMPDASSSDTAILFVPTADYAILESSDGRVELFAELAIGLGHTFRGESPSPMDAPDTSNFRMSYLVGPGLRYWLHPQLAFSGMVGLAGDFDWSSTSRSTMAGTITTNQSTGVTSIAATIALLGVFPM